MEDSDDDGMIDDESGNENDISDESLDDDPVDIIDPEPVSRSKSDDDYTFEVLTAGEVVGLIQEIIKDVNTVVQVTMTVYYY